MYGADGQVRLWHLPSSHFSEKVRWALEYKGIAHVRRTPLIVPHYVVAAALTRGAGSTFPVLELGGRAFGDSTDAVAAIERAVPSPPLYPSDPGERRRALELEEWFDVQLGEDLRTLALHHVAHDERALRQLAAFHVPAYMKPLPGLWARTFGAFIRQRYGLDLPGAEPAAREGIARAFDKLEHELGSGDHLAGDAFTVADLTAASHFYWLVQPPEGPRIVDRLPPSLTDFMAQFARRRGPRWVLGTYARHRRFAPAAEPALAA